MDYLISIEMYYSCIITIMRVGVKTLLSKGLGQICLGCLPFVGRYLTTVHVAEVITEFPKSANQAKK